MKNQKKTNLERKKRGLRNISYMSKKQQQVQRKMWRKNKAAFRERRARKASDQISDDALNQISGDSNVANSGKTSPIASCSSKNSAVLRRAKKSKKMLEIKVKQLEQDKKTLTSQNSSLRLSADRNRKKYERLEKSQKKMASPSPTKKTTEVMKLGSKEVKCQLVFSYALQKQIKKASMLVHNKKKLRLPGL